MRIAFVDPMFVWPPPGGAPVDLTYAMQGVAQAGHDVRLFLPDRDRWWGERNEADLPVPATCVPFDAAGPTRRTIGRRIREAVDAWRPDVVHLGFAFFLKPYLAAALAHHPLVLHYYAYELTCPRDYRIYLNGRTCPHNYLRTPDLCRRCAFDALTSDIRHGEPAPYAAEYLDARAYTPGYHRAVTAMLKAARAVIVNSPVEAARLAGLHPDVRMIPPGIDADALPAAPFPAPEASRPKAVLMAGRAEDPAKGVDVLREAAAALAERRRDFEVRVTWRHEERNTPWFRAIGWCSGDALRRQYAAAWCCVTPSLWDEPFGLVAAEAMATGRPVIASRVGGLGELVEDGVTGLLFERGDAAGLRDCLNRLLDDAELCARMGRAARERIARQYAWPRIIERCYLPLFEEVVR